jgi:hypothetical protein
MSELTKDEYRRIRYATGAVLRALNNCPYCGYDEHHHGDECVLRELIDVVETPFLHNLNEGESDMLTDARPGFVGIEDRLRDALVWCSGADDFAPGGKAREGWEKIVQPLLERRTPETLLDAALSELGVPTSDYPAPVANAVDLIIRAKQSLEVRA